jgi:medium-chain acyl-[acyl-carrier-protein] hydrolase
MKQSDIYTEYFKVRSYQMDTTARLNLTSIAGYLQEVAGNHASANGFGYQDMLKSGMLWVLTRMKIVVHKFPVWGDELTLDTWVVNREKFFSRRDFEIKSKQGDVLISAISGWMLVDIKKKRPQIVDAFPMNIQMFPDKLAIDEDLEKLDGPGFVNSEKHYQVKYSDLDVVQHVNNTQYQRFILDTFSIGFRSEFRLKSFEINYLAEALMDDDLKILTGRSQNQYEYKHEIRRTNDDKTICRAVSAWANDSN